MKISLIIVFLLFLSFLAFSQELPKYPLSNDVMSYNQSNLLKVDLGMNKKTVIEKMGGIQTIQTYLSSEWGFRDKTEKINNPYSRDLKSDKEGNPIEILWYYTDLKKRDGAITKDELTPVILEKDTVVGVGWGFYTDYAKRKEFVIDIR